MGSRLYIIIITIVISFFVFYVVRTVHFGMKLYNDQRNAKVKGKAIQLQALIDLEGSRRLRIPDF
jgi:hypothetical protein